MARPIAIAYCIDDADGTQHWLSAIFAHCFSRDGGRHSLIVPVVNGAISDLYQAWLTVFDPDILFLVTMNNAALVPLIEPHCSPMIMYDVKRNPRKDDEHVRLRMDSPPLTSLSWLPLLKATAGPLRAKPQLILDRYPRWRDDGLIGDNFGTLADSFSRFPLHRELADLVSPLMLSSEHAEERKAYGIDAQEIKDGYAALKEMSRRYGSGISLAHLSNMSPKRLRVRHHEWTNSFCLVIGDSFVDRVCCWNAGLLYEDLSLQPYRTLRVPSSVLGAAARGEQVKQFLNGSNWINPYGNQPQVGFP